MALEESDTDTDDSQGDKHSFPEPPSIGEISTGNIIEGSRKRVQVHRIKVQDRTKDMIYYRIASLKTLQPPKNFKEIEYRPDAQEWFSAYNKELNGLEDIGKMEVVQYNHQAKVIPILELFSFKYDNILQKNICKVRFVARDDLQQHSTNFYSPVAGQLVFRFFIHIACYLQLFPIQQLDVSNAFIYGRLNNPIYISLPMGHEKKDGRKYVWKTSSSI